MATKKMKKSPAPRDDRWRAEAAAVPADRVALRVPVHVLTAEAVDLARFANRYWSSLRDDRSGAVLRPGLELAGPTLPASTARDLLSLQRALNDAQADYLLVAPKAGEDLSERGRFVVGAASLWEPRRPVGSPHKLRPERS